MEKLLLRDCVVHLFAHPSLMFYSLCLAFLISLHANKANLIDLMDSREFLVMKIFGALSQIRVGLKKSAPKREKKPRGSEARRDLNLYYQQATVGTRAGYSPLVSKLSVLATCCRQE